MATPTPTPRRGGGRKGDKKVRINEKRRFVDGANARLTVVLRTYRSGFLTYTEHQPADSETRKRGRFKQHDSEEAARAEFEKELKEVADDGWRIVASSVPISEFDEIPKAAPSVASFPKPSTRRKQR